MSLEENKAILCKEIEAMNKQDLSSIDDLVAPDFVDHTHQEQGLESLKERLKMGFKAFPDWHETIEDIIAEGDKVCVGLKFNLFPLSNSHAHVLTLTLSLTQEQKS